MYNYKKLAGIIFITCFVLSLTIYISRKASVNKYLIKDIEDQEIKDYKVQINTASKNELNNLPGIGPSLAAKIIEHRNNYGSFEKLEDIKEVKGIGDSKYNSIEEYLAI